MTLKNITLSLLLLSISASGGCYDENLDEGSQCTSDKCDDLVGKDVRLSMGELIKVYREGQDLAYPRLFESDDGHIIDITTDVFELNVAQIAGYNYLFISTEWAPFGTRTGFVLEYREGNEGQWNRFNFDDWYWDDILLFVDPATDEVELQGNLIRSTDAGYGIEATTITQYSGQYTYAKGTEFRLFPIPVWNFWDWDEGTTAILVDFSVEEPR